MVSFIHAAVKLDIMAVLLGYKKGVEDLFMFIQKSNPTHMFEYFEGKTGAILPRNVEISLPAVQEKNQCL